MTALVRPRSVLELGTHNGFSFFVFCEAIARSGLDAGAVAVDSWVGDEHAGFYGEEVFGAVSAIREARYPSIATLFRGWFDDAAHVVEDGSVDLLHIDGRHGYDDVTHDFEAWLPKLSDRAVVLLHDTAEHLPGFGVWKFWEEVERRFPSFAFRHGHGLGVLAVGNAAPQRLIDLMSSDRGTQESVRRVYEALGRDISREHEARRSTEARLAELEARVVALASEAHELRGDVEGLRHEREHILASTSWRLTSPLRAVGSALHRARSAQVKATGR
ncbi:class I SAM-dependent methyltransferase [Agromyces bauzanensis]